MKNTIVENPQIHAATTAEISRQIKLHSERRVQIVNERATIYKNTLKSGSSPETTVMDADERAARQHAKNLLNGNAPESLSLPAEINRDRALMREQRGIDIVLKILASNEVAAKAAEAVAWSETNEVTWLKLCREITLTAIRLDALERRAGQLIEQCCDISAVRLPMINRIGSRAIFETPLSDLIENALATGVVTQSEIRRAENG